MRVTLMFCRNRRRRKREGVTLSSQHEEGMSTDDEQNLSELAHFKSEKGQVRQATM